jgi:hypothetical protein
VLTAALLAAVALHVSSARGAPFDPADTSWEGSREFVEIARAKLSVPRVVVTDVLDWSELTAADGVVVLHPDANLDFTQASAFLRAGGRLALLDDTGEGWAFLERFQIRRAAAPSRPVHAVRGDADLAVAVPASETRGTERTRHPIVAQVERLVTNHPVALEHPDLTPVLIIPSADGDATLAVTGIIVNRGRLFAMGDPSVLINLMLRYPGNRAFAEGLVSYLVSDEESGPARGGRLYIVAGRLEQKGAFGGAESVLQNLTDRWRDVTRAAREAEATGLPDSAALALAAFAALAALAWTLNVATRQYRRSLPKHALAVPLAAQGGVAGRAGVLAAPTTDRTLTLLELRALLEEGIAFRLGLAGVPRRQELVDAVSREKQGLAAELNDLFDEFDRRGRGLSSWRAFSPTRRTVEATRERVERVLSALERGSAAPSRRDGARLGSPASDNSPRDSTL